MDCVWLIARSILNERGEDAMTIWNNNGYAYGDLTVYGSRYRPALRDRKGRGICFNSEARSEEHEKATLKPISGRGGLTTGVRRLAKATGALAWGYG